MSECIIAPGSPSKPKHGYGRKWYNGKRWRAHVLAWTLKNGEVPDGLYVLHKCDVSMCINVDHLYLGTPKQNSLDMVARNRHSSGNMKKDTCKRGHKFSKENTYYFPSGGRHCKECQRIRDREKAGMK